MESPRFMPTPYFKLSPQSLFFFSRGISGQNFHFFLSVCLIKMELKVVFGDVTGILDMFQKRERSSPYTW